MSDHLGDSSRGRPMSANEKILEDAFKLGPKDRALVVLNCSRRLPPAPD